MGLSQRACVASGLLIVLLLEACMFDGSGVGGVTPPDVGVDQAVPDLHLVPDLPPSLEPAHVCHEADCPLGCSPKGRCYRLMPSNIDPGSFYGSATAQLVLDGAPSGTQSIEIDADTGAISGLRNPNDQPIVLGIYYRKLAQKDGTPVAVFAAASLYVAQGTTVRIRGSIPVVFYLNTTAQIDGVIEVRADDTRAGPGGRLGGPDNGLAGQTCLGAAKGGGQRDSLGVEWEAGGGGGGYGAEGGKGADVNCTLGDVAFGGAGGLAWGDPSLEPLRGGCGGGAGGGPDTLDTYGNGGHGGHGGGAIQISAGEQLSIGPAGGVDAAGGGGEGGHYGAGGGGGGSGGAILLESPVIALRGTVAANGGGGAAGSPLALTPDADGGHAGLFSRAQAPAGVKDPFGLGTSGGIGGAAAGPAAPGFDSAFDCNGGGGGGGVGRLRFNGNQVSGGVLSPAVPSTGPLKEPW